MAFTALCIAKKTVLMNWKNKNNLNINQYRDYLWDYISLETASADTLDQSLWAPWSAPSPSVGGGPDSVRLWFLLLAWGGNMGPGASGGSLGMGFLGGSALGLRPWPGWGIGGLLDAVSLAAACALLGMPVPADVGCQPGGRTVPGLVRGGFGDLGALCLRVGLRLAWGLGSWLVCRREHGLVHALGPGSGVGSSMHRCLRRGGGPIEAG